MELQIAPGGGSRAAAERRTATFSNDVWAAALAPARDGVQMTSVTFAPGARTYWHSHTAGQILVVLSGGGQVRERSNEGAAIRTGDVVFIPPGVEHWHGADPASAMVHLAISLGRSDWLEEVTAEQYEAATAEPPAGG